MQAQSGNPSNAAVRRRSQMLILPQIKGLQAAARGIRTGFGRILTPFLEQDCLLCGGVSTNDLVCPACAADLPRMPETVCPRCARPMPDNVLCGRCLRKPPHFDATRALFRYEFPLDKLVQSFKYAHRLALGRYFGRQLAALERIEADLIIPLPLHPERLRERGFNQALELARPVSKAWQLPIDAAICSRTRNTAAQAHLPWRQRVKNVRGAFHCGGDLSGKRILLVDDVMTTGASLDECARTLKLHGAAHISVLIVARTPPKSA